MSKQKYDQIEAVDADLAWSAACAAYRINEGYLKLPLKSGDKIIKPTNREIVTIALYDHNLIVDADRNQARAVRQQIGRAHV